MKRAPAVALVALVALASMATAQIQVFVDNNNPATGTSNLYPWGTSSGNTSLHVYTAAQLAWAGVAPGAILTDFAVAPSSESGTAGTFNAPQARLQIGHLAVDPPVPGAWLTHLDSPVTAHDLTSGPYTFAWTADTWISLPGVPAAGFVWDGTRSIGVLFTKSSSTTGAFEIHRCTNLRHYVSIFNATTQAPASDGPYAMKARMTWTGCSAGGGYTCTLAQPSGAGTDLFIDNVGGAAGSTYLNIMTQNAGTFPTGWAFGVDIPMGDLAAEIFWGDPFFGSLDACGEKHQVILAPIPSGITAYIVSVQFTSGGLVLATAPFVYVTP